MRQDPAETFRQEAAELLEQLEARLTANGVQVHWAQTPDEANAIALEIAQRTQAPLGIGLAGDCRQDVFAEDRHRDRIDQFLDAAGEPVDVARDVDAGPARDRRGVQRDRAVVRPARRPRGARPRRALRRRPAADAQPEHLPAPPRGRHAVAGVLATAHRRAARRRRRLHAADRRRTGVRVARRAVGLRAGGGRHRAVLGLQRLRPARRRGQRRLALQPGAGHRPRGGAGLDRQVQRGLAGAGVQRLVQPPQAAQTGQQGRPAPDTVPGDVPGFLQVDRGVVRIKIARRFVCDDNFRFIDYRPSNCQSLLFPKTFTRLTSFKNGAKDGLKMLVSLLPIFIVAAFFESYVTRHTHMPLLLNIAILAASASFMVWYYVLYPIQKHKQMLTHAPDSI